MKVRLSTASKEHGLWKYCLSMNLVLRDEEWHHLPIGVVQILSTDVEGDLQKVASGSKATAFETAIVDRLEAVLNSRTV